MDVDGNGEVFVVDGVYMLWILVGKFCFVEVDIMLFLFLSDNLIIEVIICDRNENLLDSDMDVYFEIGIMVNKFMVFSEGINNEIIDSGVVVKVNFVGLGSGIYWIKVINFSVFENDIGLVLIIKIKDGFGDIVIDC